MRRIYITNGGRERARISAVAGAEIVAHASLWPTNPTAEPTILFVDAEHLKSPPVVEGATVVAVKSRPDEKTHKAVKRSILLTSSAKTIRSMIEEIEASPDPIFRPFAEQWASLSDREAEVMAIAAAGWTGQETADHFDLSIRTVQTQTSWARRKKLDFAHVPRIVGLLARDGMSTPRPPLRGKDAWLEAWRSLTDRQREIALLSMMMPEKDVAIRSGTKKKTVSVHKGVIFDRLRAGGPYSYDVVQLAIDAAACGIHPEVTQ